VCSNIAAFCDKVGLRVGVNARLEIEKENKVIIPPISPEAFIKELEGCIKEGARHGSVETRENVGTNGKIKCF
jgi:hypothetical protein